MVEHLLDAPHDFVAPELLFGAWADELAAVADAHLIAVLQFLVLILQEVEIAYFLLHHPLAVERTHHLLKGCLACEQGRGNGIVLEHLVHLRLEYIHALGHILTEVGKCRVLKLRHVAHHKGLVAVRGSEVDGFMEESEQFPALRVGVFCSLFFLLADGLYRAQVVLGHFPASVLFGILSHGNSFQFHIAEVYSIDEEGDVGAYRRAHLLAVQDKTVFTLLHGTEDVLLKLLVLHQFRAGEVEQGYDFILKGDGLVLVKKDSHVGVGQHTAIDGFLQCRLQLPLIAVMPAQQPFPCLRLVGAYKLAQHRRDNQFVAHDVWADSPVAQSAILLTSGDELHHVVALYLSFVHNMLWL